MKFCDNFREVDKLWSRLVKDVSSFFFNYEKIINLRIDTILQKITMLNKYNFFTHHIIHSAHCLMVIKQPKVMPATGQ